MPETLDERIKKLVQKEPKLFPTEAKVWSYIRGALRRGLWEKSPVKFKFKSGTATPPPKSYKGKGRKGHVCALTDEWINVSASEVDHIEGHVSLLCEDDVIPYIIHLLATEDELQIVDKEAHKIKSYSERMGISFEEAKVEKEVIAFGKRSIEYQKKLLDSLGLPSNNNRVRREGYRKHLLGTN